MKERVRLDFEVEAGDYRRALRLACLQTITALHIPPDVAIAGLGDAVTVLGEMVGVAIDAAQKKEVKK